MRVITKSYADRAIKTFAELIERVYVLEGGDEAFRPEGYNG